MARAKHYLRPVGLLYGPAATEALAQSLALPLAGGPIAFAAAELIETVPDGSRRHLLSVAELVKFRDAELDAALGRVTAERPPFANLSLDQPALMGIVNVTPDSFSDGGLYDQTDGAVTHAAELHAAGAAIIDIGGESTRPGSDAVDEDDELARVLPVLDGLRGVEAAISIDTRKSGVAREAAKRGATIFNDVSALTHDPESLAAVVETGLSVILMHAKGEPKTMQHDPRYDDVVLDVFDYLQARIEAAEKAGVPRARIAADPGIGFGKTLAHNVLLLANLSLFHGLGVPLLVGASRKRFIAGLAGGDLPRDREPGSYAAALAAAAQGAQILRVHDVAGTRQALAVWQGAVTGLCGCSRKAPKAGPPSEKG